MKKLSCLVVVLAVLTGFRVSAQETFAPLITKDTVVFVHLDCSKVKLDSLKSEAAKIGETFLKELNFDSKSAKSTLQEWNSELDRLESQVRPVFETITQKLGITELAGIIDQKLLDKGIQMIIAASWKNKTEEDLQTFFSVFPERENKKAFHHVGNYLCVAFSSHRNDETNRIILTDWIKEAVPAEDGAIQQALKTLNKGDELKFAAATPTSFDGSKFAEEAGKAGIPREMLNLYLYAAKKIEWAASSFSFAQVFSPTEEEERLLTIKTIKPADAKQLRTMLETSIDWGMTAANAAIQAAQREEEFKVPPLVFEFARGYLRTLLPDIEDDKLVFRFRKSIKTVIGGTGNINTVAAVGVASALLVPATQKVRESVRQTQCANHEKTIVLAFHNYHDSHGAFPPLYTVDKDGKPLHSWRVLILPYLEQSALYDKIRLNEPWDSDYNKQFHSADVPLYSCPSCPHEAGDCCYSGVAGEGLVPAKKAGGVKGLVISDITDGTSNTFAVVEVKRPFCWMDPAADITLDELSKGINAGQVGSYHPHGINAALFDGSVQFRSNNVPKETLKAVGTRAGGESVSF
ncbi:MAG: DUF1559 domain-containing protein [Planctomycetaceae bacterium]|nr:DUF1559 domain-containing protein [Planctomycetaceae bacterium]